MADRNRDQSSSRHLSPALIGAVILALVVIDFVAQNTNDVTIHFLVWSREVSVWIALLITAVVAIVAAELFSAYMRHRRD